MRWKPLPRSAQDDSCASGIVGRFADTLEPEFPAAREHLGTHARSEEDVLSYIAFPQQAEQFFERREQTFTASYSFKEVK